MSHMRSHRSQTRVDMSRMGGVRLLRLTPASFRAAAPLRTIARPLIGAARRLPLPVRHMRGGVRNLRTSAHAHGAVAIEVGEAAVGAEDQLVYDTLSRTKQPFRPRAGQGNAVGMYVCGVTVYDFSHIGHARAYVAFDVLYRHLLSLGVDPHLPPLPILLRG